MHELSLLENVREILEEHAKTQNFERVEEVTLAIGALSCVEIEALKFAFESVMKNSLAENMRRFGTKNINEMDTYTASTQGPLTDTEIKIYDHILNAMELCIPNTPADVIVDFTDSYNKEYYIDAFKKIIDSIQQLANHIDDDMSQQAG